MTALLLLSGSILGAFLMWACMHVRALNLEADLRNQHKANMKLKADREYARGWRECSAQRRRFAAQPGVKPWQQ